MNTKKTSTKRFFATLDRNGWSYSEGRDGGWWWPPLTLAGEVRAREAARAREMQRRGLLGRRHEVAEGVCYPELP